MRLYHGTSKQAAAAIATAGFRDHVDHAGSGLVGVWFADQQAQTMWGSQDGAVVVVEIPEDEIASYELPTEPVEQWDARAGWVETGERFRTFLVPATVINRFTLTVLDDE